MRTSLKLYLEEHFSIVCLFMISDAEHVNHFRALICSIIVQIHKHRNHVQK